MSGRLARVVGWALVAALLALGALNGVWAARHLEVLRPVGLGAAAPPIDLALAGGGRYQLASGRPALLDFWASWCEPCREELPMIDRLAARYRGRADVVAVNVEDLENEAEVRAYLRTVRFTLPIALGGGPAAEAYHVEGLPHLVVVGRDGKVRRVFVGETAERDLTAALDAAE